MVLCLLLPKNKLEKKILKIYKVYMISFCGLYTTYLGQVLYGVLSYFSLYIDLTQELYVVLSVQFWGRAHAYFE